MTRHDLKGPISGIVGLAQGLAATPGLAHESLAQLKTIEERRSGDRHDHAIDRTLQDRNQGFPARRNASKSSIFCVRRRIWSSPASPSSR